MKITDIVQTCGACPSLWKCTVDGRKAYVKFRWGYIALKLEQGRSFSNKEIFGEQISDEWDGIMSTDKMKEWLSKQENVEII